jgi:hypothetical protein
MSMFTFRRERVCIKEKASNHHKECTTFHLCIYYLTNCKILPQVPQTKPKETTLRPLGFAIGLAFAYQGKDIVFRFIIECSSLRDFGPLGNNNGSILT